jgi:hypothetical protein
MSSNTKVIPLFLEPKNSPFVPNKQKNIIEERLVEEGKKQYVNQPYNTNQQKYPKQQTPLVDLQVYEPSKPPPKPKTDLEKAAASIIYAPLNTANPYYPPQLYQAQPIPIIKNYNINVSGPTTDHAKVSSIYEDILPSKDLATTFNTLGERINLFKFIRSVFIKGDGDNISLDENNVNNRESNANITYLLRYIKFMELNPYYNSSFNDSNPYKGLPDNMLIYRSCYPIRYSRQENCVQCAKNSVGLNVRIYGMSIAEYNIKKQNIVNYYESDLWREVAYYEYVREEIVKKKACPNFVIMYGYYISEKSNIDFNKLNNIKKGVISNIYQKSCNNNLNNNLNLNNNTQVSQAKQVATQVANHLFNKANLNNKQTTTTTTTCIQELSSLELSNKAIVSLTEAPTYNIFSWCTKTHKLDVSGDRVYKMVNCGFHTNEVWISVIFQILAALHTLQLHNIAFNEFDMANNIFIKDLSDQDNIITKYWKYKVDDIDYYVPNYGYLVLLDSSFKDNNNINYSLIKTNKANKIYSNTIFGNLKEANNNLTREEINQKCFSSFTNCFNNGIFSNSFVDQGGIKPGDIYYEICKLANLDNKISNAIHTSSLTKMLHNRVGTCLKTTEIHNVRKDDVKLFRNGQFAVIEPQVDMFTFVIIKERDLVDLNTYSVFIKKGDNIIIEQIDVKRLFSYSNLEGLDQVYKPNEAILNEDGLLETYRIN